MVKSEDFRPGDGDPDHDKVSHQGFKRFVLWKSHQYILCFAKIFFLVCI